MSEQAIAVGDIVKYSKPAEGEQGFRFIVLDVFDPVGEGRHWRVEMQAICTLPFAPIETVDIGEAELVEKAANIKPFTNGAPKGWSEV